MKIIIAIIALFSFSCHKELQLPTTPTNVTLNISLVDNQWQATSTLSQKLPSTVRVVFSFEELNGLKRAIKSSIDISPGELRRTYIIMSANGSSLITNVKIIAVESQGYSNFTYSYSNN